MATRSGIIALGLIEGDWHIIAPFSEGRGAQTGKKAYGLAKGGTVSIGQFLEEMIVPTGTSPDSQPEPQKEYIARELDTHAPVDRDFIRAFHGWGEDVPDHEIDRYIHQITANVEFREETGIDISTLENGGYEGVRLIKRSTELAEDFDWKQSPNRDLHMDVVLVENMAGLLPHLKGKNKPDMALEDAIERASLPTFDSLHARFLTILKESDSQPSYWEQYDTPDKFLTFTHPSTHDDPFSPYFRRAATQVKNELYDAGTLRDDWEIKLDDRVSPLRYYREGADIMPVNTYVDAIRTHGENCTGEDAKKIMKYRQDMVGNSEMPGQLDVVHAALDLAKRHYKPVWVEQIKNSVRPGNRRFVPASLTTTEPIQAVLFDFDDVLMDTAAYSREVFELTFKEMENRGHTLAKGISYSDRNANERSMDFMKRVFEDPDVAKEAYSLKKQMDKTLCGRQVDGAKRTLQFLDRAGIPFAVISNSRTDEVRARFANLFGDEFKDTVILGDAKKPDATRVAEALELMGIASHPQHVLYVGDRIDTDAEVAIAAGCYPVIFGSKGYDALEKTKGTGNHQVGYVENHAALRSLVERRLPQQQAAFIH